MYFLILVRLPSDQCDLAKYAIDILLKLCKNLSCRGIIAQSSLVKSLTSAPELIGVISNRSHPLHTSLLDLLACVASFSMTSDCFVSFLRCIGLPLLRDEKHGEKVVLPVIVSSLQAFKTSYKDKYREANDNLFCEYLAIAVKVAANEEVVSRFMIGGESIDRLLFYMQDTAIEDRMYHLARDGNLSFVEIPFIYKRINSSHSSTSGPDERLWGPSSVTGFTFSIWLRLSKISLSHQRKPRNDNVGYIFLLDLHTSPTSYESHEHLTIWYDLGTSQVNVSTSYNAAKKPETFPSVSLSPDVWNHISITYSFAKRSLLGKKVQLNLYVNGKDVGEVKIDQINLPLSSRCLIGCCNPKLLESGKKYLRGSMPQVEVSSVTLISRVLSSMEASAIFFVGPDFDSVFWGNSPQRSSLRANASCALSRINVIDSDQAINDSLRSRKWHFLQNSSSLSSSLESGKLNCIVSPNEIVFAFRANATKPLVKSADSICRLKNITSLSSMASSDASLLGRSTMIVPNSFCIFDILR